MEAAGFSEMLVTTYQMHGVSKRTLRKYLPTRTHQETLNFLVLTCESKKKAYELRTPLEHEFRILKAVFCVTKHQVTSGRVAALSVSCRLPNVKALRGLLLGQSMYDVWCGKWKFDRFSLASHHLISASCLCVITAC
jgi:hypothetical protein